MSYLTFDGQFITQIRCMRCNDVIVDSKIVGQHRKLKRLPNYREVTAEMDDDEGNDLGIMVLMSCDGCLGKNWNLKKVMEDVQWGWEQEVKAMKNGDVKSKVNEWLNGEKIKIKKNKFKIKKLKEK